MKVENANATYEQVTSLGGDAMAAFDIGDQGRIAALRVVKSMRRFPAANYCVV